MKRLALAAVLTLAWASAAAGQASPFNIPQPMGGPIIGPDGKVRTGLDAHPVASPWSGGIDLGISGSQGSADTLKLWTGLELKYDDPDYFGFLKALYVLNQANSGQLENKGFLLTRHELPADMGLAVYGQASLEYDASQVIDLRFASHSGLSYAVVQDGTQVFKVRAGAGVEKPWGGASDTWTWEAQVGLDYEYRLSERSRITVIGDLYPAFEDFANYRARVWATLDILIDPKYNAYLRLGALDRYNSRPDGSPRNNVDYYLGLMFGF
jgi:opacity protein-like surface antigen